MGPQAANAEYDLEKIDRVRDAQERNARGRAFSRDNDRRAIDDLNMYAGGERQWDAAALRERKADRRPILTDNRFPALIKQVTGEIRRNPFAIKCTPADGAATDAKAKVREGIIRYIERASNAPRVYARCGQHIAQGGVGWMRLALVHANATLKFDLSDFDSDIRIQSIRNPVSVTVDPDHANDDDPCAEAKWAQVEMQMDRKAFEKAYPGKSSSAAMTAPKTWNAWSKGDKVTIVEDWIVKQEPATIHRVIQNKPYWSEEPIDEFGTPQGWVEPSNAETVVVDPDDVLRAEMEREGWTFVQERPGFKSTICMYLMGGTEQLAGPIEQPWTRIPLFRAVGEETDIGDEVFRHGLVYHGRDSQRRLNSAVTFDYELMQAAPKAPMIVASKQVEGFEAEWNASLKKHLPYLRYKHVEGLQAPRRAEPVSANTGPANAAMAAIDAMKSNVGIFDASIGKGSRETSGVAIEARDAQADTGTFVYIDNLADCIEAMGRELVAVIPEVYSTRQQITILGEDDTPEILEVANQPPGFWDGRYDCVVKTGPAYETKREKERDQFIELAQTAGPLQPLYHIEIARRTDGQEEFAQRLERAAYAMALIPPDQEAAPPMPGNGMPPMPGAPMPPGPPPGVDPLAQVSPPPFVPAGRPRVANGGPPMGGPPAVAPGMMGAM